MLGLSIVHIYESIHPMTTHVSVKVPGWVASRLSHMPDANAVPSFRRITRCTDDTLEYIINQRGKTVSFGLKTDGESSGTVLSYPYTTFRSTRQRTSSSDAIGAVVNTVYTCLVTEDFPIEIHRSISNDSVEWFIEAESSKLSADELVKRVSKYIS